MRKEPAAFEKPTHIGIYYHQAPKTSEHNFVFYLGSALENERKFPSIASPKRYKNKAMLVHKLPIPEKFLEAVQTFARNRTLARERAEDKTHTYLGHIGYKMEGNNLAGLMTYFPKGGEKDRSTRWLGKNTAGLGALLGALSAIHLKEATGAERISTKYGLHEAFRKVLARAGIKTNQKIPIDEFIEALLSYHAKKLAEG